MRRNAWLLALALVVGCAFRGEVPPQNGEPAEWPDVIKNGGLFTDNGDAKSAKDLLEEIIAMAPGPEVPATQLRDKATERLEHRFEEYIPRVAWTRVLIAYRYTQRGKQAQDNSDPALRDRFFDLARVELEKGGSAPDPSWAANTAYGPSNTARRYLEDIKAKASLLPSQGGAPNTPWPEPSSPFTLRNLIIQHCDDLLVKHDDHDGADPQYNATATPNPAVDLNDEVAWARVVCAYYASEYAGTWAITKDELDHIDD